jgi:hypothetical protein
VWCTVKTVISCPISKITLCSDFLARETQGCRAIHRDCRYFQYVDCRIVWNLPQDPRLLWNQTKSLILKIRAGYDIAFKLHSAGSYAADAERSSLSAVRSPKRR